jgi:hypothetical protein
VTWDSEIEVPPNLENILQMASLYDGYIVVTKGDPLNRNRVRVCCPELWGEGEENWSNWLDVAGTPVGSGKLEGDAGIHWPCLPGQRVLVGYSSLDPLTQFIIPAGIWSSQSQAGKQEMPLEAKYAADNGEAHKINIIKTEAGHTLGFNNVAGKETLFLVDWTGQGIFMTAFSKGEDKDAGPNQATPSREAETRLARFTIDGTSKEIDELTKDGKAGISICGLNGMGFHLLASKDGNSFAVTLGKGKDGKPGPSFVMSGKDGGSIVITAGEAQAVFNGKDGSLQVTKQLIDQAVKVEVEKQVEEIKKSFRESIQLSFPQEQKSSTI